MKKIIGAFIVLCIMLPGSILTVGAQVTRPPAIFHFASDSLPVTVAELETGEQTAILAWHVAHMTGQHRLQLTFYQGSQWIVLISEETLPPVGTHTLTLEHPYNVGPPTYRLTVLDSENTILDERTLIIPYDTAAMDALTPEIQSFTTTVQNIDAVAMTGDVQLDVTWDVRDRLPLTNLVFEQVLSDEQVQNVELPRDLFWVPSRGTGKVAPVQPSNGSIIQLRLQVVDVITADVYDETLISVSIIGTALPEVPPPATAEPAPTEDTSGEFDVPLTACPDGPDAVPTRGWQDGPGVRSPDNQHIAYSTNIVGDARLIITRADGSGQVIIEAPDKNLPIGIQPSWSPDGQRIAFTNIVLAPPGGGTIYSFTLNDQDLRPIATYTGYHDALNWSPDGSELTFTNGVATESEAGITVGGYQVYRVATDSLGTPALLMEGCGAAQ